MRYIYLKIRSRCNIYRYIHCFILHDTFCFAYRNLRIEFKVRHLKIFKIFSVQLCDQRNSYDSRSSREVAFYSNRFWKSPVVLFCSNKPWNGKLNDLCINYARRIFIEYFFILARRILSIRIRLYCETTFDVRDEARDEAWNCRQVSAFSLNLILSEMTRQRRVESIPWGKKWERRVEDNAGTSKRIRRAWARWIDSSKLVNFLEA